MTNDPRRRPVPAPKPTPADQATGPGAGDWLADQGTLPVGAVPRLDPGAIRAVDGLSPTLPGTGVPPPAGLPASHPLADMPGYEILGVLGRGGMGVVYKARQPKLKRLVALKMILSGEHASAEDMRRFQTEAEAIARLLHPNIVQVYEVGEHNGKPYFSLEFCPGGSLAQELDGTPLPPREAARLVEALARAMHVAHQKGVIHRDLKPANVLRGEDGTPKITDFGLARKIEDARHTASGSVLGSPSYMAPEQAQGHTQEIGPLTDVYALGAILYECLTGQPPFRAATMWETVTQVISQEPVAPASLQPRVPADLNAICLKCLQKSPSGRYESAEALAEDLRRFQAGEPVRARPLSAATRLARWCRRRPLQAGLIGAVAALLVLVAAVTSIGYLLTWQALEREEDQRAEADRQRDEAQHQREAARVAETAAREETARTRRLLYAANLQLASHLWNSETGTAAAVRALLVSQVKGPKEEDLRDFAWRYQWRLFQGDASIFRGHAKGVVRLTVGRDGSLVTVDGEGRLRRWPAGKEKAAYTTAPAAGLVALAADGSAATASKDGTVRLLDPETGKERLHFLASHPVTGLRFLPGGRALLTRDGDGAVVLWDTSTGRQMEALGPRGLSYFTAETVFAPDGQLAATRTGQIFNVATLLDFRKGSRLGNLPAPTKIVSMTFSPDGKKLATGHFDGDVIVWEVATRKAIGQPLNAHASRVTGLAFSPDGNRLATGAFDGQVAVWDLATRQRVRRCMGHVFRVTALRFGPGGTVLASGDVAGTARLWDLAVPPEPRPLAKQDQVVFGLALAPDGRWLATGEGISVRLWDTRTGQAGKILKGPKKARGRIYRVAVAPDGRTLAAGEGAGRVRLWDPATGRELRVLQGPARPKGDRLPAREGVGSLAFSPDGTLVAAGFGRADYRGPNHSQSVRIWEAASGKEVRTLAAHKNAIHGLAFSANGRLMATASDDATARVWRVGTWEEVRCFTHKQRLESLALSPDGQLLAAGTVTGLVHVWEIATGKSRYLVKAHASEVTGLAFSPDGKTLASAGDRTVQLWDVVSGRNTLTLPGHTEQITSLAFAPDGNALATGGRDRTIRLWRAATVEEVAAALAVPPPPEEAAGENAGGEETP